MLASTVFMGTIIMYLHTKFIFLAEAVPHLSPSKQNLNAMSVAKWSSMTLLDVSAMLLLPMLLD